MANPQSENGHIDIANEIAEHLTYYRLSGQEYQVLWVVWRKTWGWHKKEDKISLSQFYDFTKMKKPSIIKALNKLIEKNIISKKANGYSSIYRFNKDFDTWKSLAKRLIVSKKANGVSKKANGVSKKATHKRNSSKETIQKKKDINTHFEIFWKEYPKRNGKKAWKEGTKEKFLKIYINGFDFESLLKATKNYAKSSNPQNNFALDPIRFLKKNYWKDFIEDMESKDKFNFLKPQNKEN